MTYQEFYGGYHYLNDNFNNKKNRLSNQPINLLFRNEVDYSKLHLISFASTDSNFSKERFIDEAAAFGFNNIRVFTEKDFSDDYINKYGSHFQDKRGYGYWSWKSYIIKTALDELEEDEYLIYVDCGSSFNVFKKHIFENIWMKRIQESDSGVFCPGLMKYLEMDWNKADCVNYINERYNTAYSVDDRILTLNAATVILFNSSDKAKQFVNDWFDICNNHYDLITDKPSVNEHKYLIEHRHDLSVFSLLTHIYNVSTISTHRYGIDDRQNAPIYASKIKNDKETYLLNRINNNVDIFICTHKDFNAPYNPVYKIICGNGLIHNNYPLRVYEDNYDDNPDVFLKEYSYAEGSRINYIRRNIELKDYVGIVHYRKYFWFSDNPAELPDFNQIFKTHDIVLLDAQYGNLFGMYNGCHFGLHLMKCIEIGREMFPEYNNEFERAFQEDLCAYYCNMFVMKKADFYNMCDFVYGILSQFDKEMNFNTDEDIHRWVEQNVMNSYCCNKDVNYQSRADGFLTERLFSIWVWHNFSPDRIYTKPLHIVGNYRIRYGKTQQ